MLEVLIPLPDFTGIIGLLPDVFMNPNICFILYLDVYIYIYKYPFVVGHIFPLPVNPSAFPCQKRRPSDTHVALEMLKDGGYSCGFV